MGLPLTATNFLAVITNNWYNNYMAKNTSVLIGDHFERFIGEQVKTGRFGSASEVVCAALRAFEQGETKKDQLITALKEGEDSGFVDNFDPKQFLAELHLKYVKK